MHQCCRSDIRRRCRRPQEFVCLRWNSGLDTQSVPVRETSSACMVELPITCQEFVYVYFYSKGNSSDLMDVTSLYSEVRYMAAQWYYFCSNHVTTWLCAVEDQSSQSINQSVLIWLRQETIRFRNIYFAAIGLDIHLYCYILLYILIKHVYHTCTYQAERGGGGPWCNTAMENKKSGRSPNRSIVDKRKTSDRLRNMLRIDRACVGC